MTLIRLVPLVALLALTACETPSPKQRRLLDSMVGQPEVSLIRQFGVPTRTFSANGHNFLAYVDNQTSYYSGGGSGWGWGWGGGGWGWGGPGWGGGWGGWGSGYGMGGPGGWGGGWGGSTYSSSCQTTFEVIDGKVSAWTMRGDGC
ncbi:hypothetical protein AA103196_1452 [Ameyamaea chiangmaiensis NBRC 103196]|uniref:Uncharacterized protein n=1 Tax=Ameyamaea chiangmaiensis TaxID=442969 RepID=A0A850P731_9PROT|nr:hypothetical protein [Ameyamaea chiangmaiensis]MBS4075274.1 hypothetical protein [Ameyamaea chiangmaiensis]NVN40417.1 hypothetical protein [Ameyamaea chiangmaiensis]GBQ66619.1 hypothetical protein AA103196_1452 [Ameyamaea chiangmaiensis NBRC 103196]